MKHIKLKYRSMMFGRQQFKEMYTEIVKELLLTDEGVYKKWFNTTPKTTVYEYYSHVPVPPQTQDIHKYIDQYFEYFGEMATRNMNEALDFKLRYIFKGVGI